MDMTYFALFPPPLKRRNLKIAIVFNYEAFRFEAWLAGSNRKVQRQYWELFRDSQWTDYRVVAPARGIDSIVECDLARDFDLSDPDALTSIIEAATAFEQRNAVARGKFDSRMASSARRVPTVRKNYEELY